MKMMPDHFRSQVRLLSGTQRIKELQMVQHLILREEKDRRRDKSFWRERSSGPLLLGGRGWGSFVDLGNPLGPGVTGVGKQFRTEANIVSDPVPFSIGG